MNEMRGGDSDKEEQNETAVLETEVQAEEIPQGPSQVVCPRDKECSCGNWQEYHYPCRHALAWFKCWQSRNLQWVLDNEVDDGESSKL